MSIITIIVMVAVFGIAFVDYMQQNNLEEDETTVALLAHQSYQ